MVYKLLVYNVNDRHSSHTLGQFESVEPFLALSKGDYLDPSMNEWLGLEDGVHFQIVRLEHDFSGKSHSIKLYIGLAEPE